VSEINRSPYLNPHTHNTPEHMSEFAFFGLMTKVDRILTTMEDDENRRKLQKITEQIRKECSRFISVYSHKSAFSEFQTFFPYLDRCSERQQTSVRTYVGFLTRLYLQCGTLTDDDTKSNINYENTDITGLTRKITTRCDVFFSGLELDKKGVDADDLRTYMNTFIVHNFEGLDMPRSGGINEKFWRLAGAPLTPFGYKSGI
jgi:hypothetical protein